MNRAERAERTADELRKKNRVISQHNTIGKDQLNKKEMQVSELEQRIKELENRPIDVVVQTEDSLLKEREQEISELKEQIERMSDKSVKSFVIRMSLDEYDQLFTALEQADDRLKNIIRRARILKI